jgi:hypothetical protein
MPGMPVADLGRSFGPCLLPLADGTEISPLKRFQHVDNQVMIFIRQRLLFGCDGSGMMPEVRNVMEHIHCVKHFYMTELRRLHYMLSGNKLQLD